MTETRYNHRRRLVLCVMMLCADWTAQAGAADTKLGTTNVPPRLKFAVLPFRNASGEASLDRWRLTVASFLSGRLALARGVRDADWEDQQYVLTNSGWTLKSNLDPNLVPLVARKLKLDAVVWGSFTRPSGGWVLQVSVLRRPFTNAASTFEVKSARTAELLTEAPAAIAERLGVKLPPDQREKWLRHGVGSETAWAGLAQAITMEFEDAPNAEVEKALQDILRTEPGFVQARAMLAGVLRHEKKLNEAEAECRDLIRSVPDLCSGHEDLAGVLKDEAAAEAEVHEALRVQPGCPRAFRCLAAVLYNLARWKELRELLEKANQQRPGELWTQAVLASARSRCEDFDGAEALLREIGDIGEEQDIYVHASIIEPALSTGDYDRFGREFQWLRKRATTDRHSAELLTNMDALFHLQSRKPFPITRPHIYTAGELEADLKHRLAPEERALVVNPVEIAPEIAALAKEVTGDVTNLMLRAMLLFSDVVQRGRGAGDWGARTAQDAFKASQQPEGSLSCQEFAKLFVALARASGLQAWPVHVDELATGQTAFHDCAALFLGDEGCLVDPALGIFGVRHRAYRILDDLQAIAHHAMQSLSPTDLPRQRAARKLDPEDTWTRLRLIEGLAKSDLPDEAEAELNQLPPGVTNRWDYWDASAEIACARQQWAKAVSLLQRALELSPSNAMVHVELSAIYNDRLNDTKKAREHAEAAQGLAPGQLTSSDREKLKSFAAYFGVLEQGQSGRATDLDALRKKAQGGDALTKMALAELLFKSDPPQIDEAMEWMRQAADQGEVQAQRNHAGNLLKLRGPETAPEAFRYYKLAAEQGDAEAQCHLGQMLYEGQGIPKDVVAACQWTILASRQGDKDTKYLMAEMQLFHKDQFAEATRRADRFKPKAPPPPKTR